MKEELQSCPFCKKDLIVSSVSGPHGGDNLYCTTYVDVSNDRRWCHFFRVEREYTEYEVIIPPFDIIWEKETRTLRVEQFRFECDLQISYIPTSSIAGFRWQQIYEQKNTSYDDFINAYYRFEKLKAFS